MAFTPEEVKQLQKLRPDLVRFCNFISDYDPEGDCQETILRAWKHQDKFQSGTNLKAWLFMIARNYIYSESRRRFRQIAVGDEKIQQYLQREALSGGQHESLELKQAIEIIIGMPEEKQSALMVSFNGQNFDEASAKMNVPVGTIKSRASRARSDLAIALDPGAPGLK